MRNLLMGIISEKEVLGDSISDVNPNTMTDPPPPSEKNKPKKSGSKPGPDKPIKKPPKPGSKGPK